jgi:afadin
MPSFPGEDAFLSTVIHDVNGNSIQFKLAPTYTLYMAVRYRVHKLKHMDMSPNEHNHWINAFTNKIVNVTQQTIQVRKINETALFLEFYYCVAANIY